MLQFFKYKRKKGATPLFLLFSSLYLFVPVLIQMISHRPSPRRRPTHRPALAQHLQRRQRVGW
jgi:hypothetical protein